MRLCTITYAALLSGALALCGARAEAQDPPALSARQEPPPLTARQIVTGYNAGLRLTVSPGVVIPQDGGRVGLSIGADLRYGFVVGPLILAPGLRPTGYFFEHLNVAAMPATLRLTVPVGPVGPFLIGGAGPGFVSRPKEFGVAVIGGVGFMVHIGMHFGIGAEATYHMITGTDFRALFVGPSILIAF